MFSHVQQNIYSSVVQDHILPIPNTNRDSGQSFLDSKESHSGSHSEHIHQDLVQVQHYHHLKKEINKLGQRQRQTPFSSTFGSVLHQKTFWIQF